MKFFWETFDIGLDQDWIKAAVKGHLKMLTPTTAKMTVRPTLTKEEYGRMRIRATLNKLGFRPEFITGVYTLKRIPLNQFKALVRLLEYLQKYIDKNCQPQGLVPLLLPSVKEFNAINLEEFMQNDGIMRQIFESAITKKGLKVYLGVLCSINRDKIKIANKIQFNFDQFIKGQSTSQDS